MNFINFKWLDDHSDSPKGKFISQIMPVIICLILFIIFMLLSYVFIEYLINPFSAEKIEFHLESKDIIAGFLLYFLTAIDYALVIGRMQISNSGSKARFIMNVLTCVGCFVGVTLVLFLWGFAKEVPWLIIPILLFAGSVMVKLAYEGSEYFADSDLIPKFIRKIILKFLQILYFPTRIFTYWIPELNAPKVQKLSYSDLAKWSFLLPFIIGTDDLVGYMGAMTVYNVFGLLTGIYLADILIDIMVFVSPEFTKKVVENAILSLIGAFAFLYLAYKSYSESYNLLHEYYRVSVSTAGIVLLVFVGSVFLADVIWLRFKKYSK